MDYSTILTWLTAWEDFNVSLLSSLSSAPNAFDYNHSYGITSTISPEKIYIFSQLEKD
jgi:hypothetical protein